jgi:uridine kinase
MTTRWAPEKKDVLAALATEILHNYGKGRVIVAVDGIDGAGKTHFADALAAAMQLVGASVFRAGLDDFHRPRAERWARGRDSAEGHYLDSYDYSALKRLLVEPFRMGGSTAFVPAAFDVERDAWVEPRWLTGPADAVLIVDGLFANRPELSGLWNYSIWVDVPRAVAAERLLARDGAPDPAAGDRYTDGQELYWQAVKPRERANAIIDNTDFEHPRRRFADSC